MAAPRTLHVRCGTWEQVDVFVSRKLRKGRLLSMKVPFATAGGVPVTLGLELPNQVVIAIDGTIQRATPVEGDHGRTWIEIDLFGMTDEVMQRLRQPSVVDEPLTDPVIAPAPPARRSPTNVDTEELPADERALFQHLSAELRRLRQVAVHEVLGVPPDAGPAVVRDGWKNLVRRHHPDLVARRNAPAITHLAEELTILSNRAYDRLRAALAADGRGTVAGSTVAPTPGWLVGFEDLQSGDKTPIPKNRFDRAQTPAERPARSTTPAEGSDAFEQRARTMLGVGDAAQAREVLAAALVVYPRARSLRSLYYVASALAAVQEGELMLAQSQLETALAHHEGCTEAAQMLDQIRRGGSDAEAMTRIFQ